MEFHYFPGSHWSRVVSLAVAEKGLEPQRCLVDIRRNANFEPEYLRLNARGVVPTWVADDGRVICGSREIVEHLDTFGGSPLLVGHAAETEVRSWADRLTGLPTMLYSYSVWIEGRKGERSADILDDKIARGHAYAQKYPEFAEAYLRKARFFEKFKAQVLDEAHVAQQMREGQAFLDELTAMLGASDWLPGEAPSYADCLLASVLYRLRDLERLDTWAHTPTHRLAQYMARWEARPSFRFVWREDPLLKM